MSQLYKPVGGILGKCPMSRYFPNMIIFFLILSVLSGFSEPYVALTITIVLVFGVHLYEEFIHEFTHHSAQISYFVFMSVYAAIFIIILVVGQAFLPWDYIFEHLDLIKITYYLEAFERALAAQ